MSFLCNLGNSVFKRSFMAAVLGGSLLLSAGVQADTLVRVLSLIHI